MKNKIFFTLTLLFSKNPKLAFRYFLWMINYQQVLPVSIINSIPIKENNEKMVEIINSAKLINESPDPLLRESVWKKLSNASLFLPDGYRIVVLFAYRDLETQKKFWDEVYAEQKQKYPTLSETEIVEKARLYSAEPTGDGPHQSGGAIDVTILDENGITLDMGTTYREHSLKTPMFSPYCTHEQRKNRKFLRNIMLKAGFTYYPGEWWHYCYGDRMWAAYTGNSCAVYGSVTIAK